MEFRRKMWPSELVSLVLYQRTFCGDVQGTLGDVSLELPREVSHSFDGVHSLRGVVKDTGTGGGQRSVCWPWE